MYLDNILIYTETKAEHVKVVHAILNKRWAAKLYAKLSKCEFHKEKIDYLGYQISHEAVMDPEKVQSVIDLHKEAGFANFYRQFIPAFAQIALPINNLIKTRAGDKPKPSQLVKWTMECQATFEKLKRLFFRWASAITSGPGKAYCNPSWCQWHSCRGCSTPGEWAKPVTALCLHFQKIDRDRAMVGSAGEGSLCCSLGSPHLAPLSRGEQDPIPGVDWP